MPNGLMQAARLVFGFAGIASGVIANGVAYFLLIYYSQVLGLSASLTGLAMLITLACDAVTDPLVGRWSDRTRARLGRRHPFLYAAIVPTPLLYYLLWNPPTLSEWGLFAYLVATAVCLRTALTLFYVPMTAIIPELTRDYDERTRLFNVWTSSAWLFGTLMTVAMYGYWLADTSAGHGFLRATGYEEAGAFGAVVVLLSMAVSVIVSHRFIPRLRTPDMKGEFKRSGSLGESSREVWETIRDPSVVALLVSGAVSSAASGTAAVLWVYVQPYFWGFDSDQLVWMLTAQLISPVIAFTLLPTLAGHWDKKPLIIRVSIVSLVLGTAPIALRLFGWFPGNGDPALFPLMIGFGVVNTVLYIMASVVFSVVM